MSAALYIVLTFVAQPAAGRGRPLGLPRPGKAVLMLDRLLAELPRFFSYYTVLFLVQAMGTHAAVTLSAACLGFVAGLLLVLLRQTPGLVWAPVRLARGRLCRVLPPHPVPGHLYLVLFFFQAFSRTRRCSRSR